MKTKMFRVYYEENIAYETYIEALNEQDAKEQFVHTLEIDDALEPITMDVLEFEAEEMSDMHYQM